MTQDLRTTIDALAEHGKKIIISKAKAADEADALRLQEIQDIEHDLLYKLKAKLPENPLEDYYSLRQEWDDAPPRHPVLVQSGNNFYLWINVEDLAPILMKLKIVLCDPGRSETAYHQRAWNPDWEIDSVELLSYSACDTWEEHEDVKGEYFWKRAPGHDCPTIEEAVYYARKEFDRFVEYLVSLSMPVA